jgi:hypothetical protein
VRTKLAVSALAPGIRAALESIDSELPAAEYHELGELVDRPFLRVASWCSCRACSPRPHYCLPLLESMGLSRIRSTSALMRSASEWPWAHRVATCKGVFAQTIALVSSGIAIGVAGALILARVIASLLFRLEPSDPLTFGITVAVLLVVAILAGYVPALRASRVDPMSAAHELRRSGLYSAGRICIGCSAPRRQPCCWQRDQRESYRCSR